MAFNATSNPYGSTQNAAGRVIADGRPVYDASRGHLMPAGHDAASAPQHGAARRGQSGYQRRG
ncbi:hypothetical protein ACFQFC_35165 [Amorphoplanes digitatis]|uniref:Uncharacterized protein n=1 Tax=Actinoplanes digitatis TaxID=1868 RepID=A0A7W7MPD5_9ACTN|nr:hypothetical protein [Actinoplanes digitatis]MBB4761405.1 hypothetical protein [Actinoplanes digitatis]BFE69828.1 hypothetical protein GCM10020092_031290 [Actinoplanes digitatis]GID94549.1 hypothetical protein Adi01nite_39610 [Actinoplanes digitatis]